MWPSVAQKLRESYRIAKMDRVTYRRMSERGRDRMQDWGSYGAVWQRLSEALNFVSEKSAVYSSSDPANVTK